APGSTATFTATGTTIGGSVTFAVADDPANPGDDGDADIYAPLTVTDGGVGDLDGQGQWYGRGGVAGALGRRCVEPVAQPDGHGSVDRIDGRDDIHGRGWIDEQGLSALGPTQPAHDANHARKSSEDLGGPRRGPAYRPAIVHRADFG